MYTWLHTRPTKSHTCSVLFPKHNINLLNKSNPAYIIGSDILVNWLWTTSQSYCKNYMKYSALEELVQTGHSKCSVNEEHPRCLSEPEDWLPSVLVTANNRRDRLWSPAIDMLSALFFSPEFCSRGKKGTFHT